MEIGNLVLAFIFLSLLIISTRAIRRSIAYKRKTNERKSKREKAYNITSNSQLK